MCQVSPTEPFFRFKQGKEISRTKKLNAHFFWGQEKDKHAREGLVLCPVLTGSLYAGGRWRNPVGFPNSQVSLLLTKSRFPRHLLRNGPPPSRNSGWKLPQQELLAEGGNTPTVFFQPQSFIQATEFLSLPLPWLDFRACQSSVECLFFSLFSYR